MNETLKPILEQFDKEMKELADEAEQARTLLCAAVTPVECEVYAED